MGKKTAINVRATNPVSGVNNTPPLQHKIIGVEFIPEEVPQAENRTFPPRVSFNSPTPPPAVARSDEAKQLFFNKRRLHDSNEAKQLSSNQRELRVFDFFNLSSSMTQHKRDQIMPLDNWTLNKRT